MDINGPMTAAAASQLSPLKRAFLALEEAEARLAEAQAAGREPIAVIGLGCRLPGADGPAAFWELLRGGVDAIAPVPDGRFDLESLHGAPAADAIDSDTIGRSATKEAGFLRQIDQFDPVFFGITRREAHGMDPQQRLLLEVSWEALENAGRAPDRLERSLTGVYFGVCSNDYANLQLQADDPTLLDAHYTSGLAHSVASGRISYVLGLQGPSLTVDTACSSSLVAVHLACQALRTRDCHMALAGGVNLMLSPDLFVAFSNTRMLAADGRCKTFDASADGFGRGEGCGVVVLKRLSDAMADGDRILAVIRGSAVNQDGPSSGLTAPNGPAQEEVIREALKRAGVAPREVGYVEAHGTGTQLGDPIEVQALDAVFGQRRASGEELLIGSVKTNCGHLEAAAGITGLIKLILSLRQRTIPPNLHFSVPNPHIAWSDFAVRVPTAPTPWVPIEGRRIGGVSSFGFSGTNAHVVIEEAPDVAPREGVLGDRDLQLFVLSAKSRDALAALAKRCADDFAGRSHDDLADVCFSSAIAKAQHAHRAAILARTMSELVDRLRALADGRECEGVRATHVTRRDPARVAFFFTGQGSQYAGMARELDARQPAFRAALDRCASILDPLLQRPLRELLFDQSTPSMLDQTNYTQPALFSVEYALSELWRSWGVRPQIVIGHSIGELVAACVAGTLSLEDALRLTAERGRLMQSLPKGGAMAAINAPEATVAQALRDQDRDVAIAAINAPEQSVISGRAPVVKALCERFASQGIRCQSLDVSHAFHSPLVDPVLDAFEEAASKVIFNKPKLRVISNVVGGQANAEEFIQPKYWRRHIRETVRFADGIAALANMKPDVCMELGPQPTLLTFVNEVIASFGSEPPALVASLRKGRRDQDQIAEALATLFVAGVAIDWRAVWAARPGRLVDMPSYPFERERCWFQIRAGRRATSSGREIKHPLLGWRVRSALTEAVQFEQSMRAEDFTFLRDHQVHGRTILPATAYLELASAAGREALTGEVQLHDVTIEESLVFEGNQERIVQTIIRRSQTGASFEVLSVDSSHEDSSWRSHARGSIKRATPEIKSSARLDVVAVQARCSEYVDSSAHYSRLKEHRLEFGPGLQGVRGVWRRDGEALGEIELRSDMSPDDSRYLFHPALLDACLQCLVWTIPARLTKGKAWLPLAIDEFVRYRAGGGKVWSHAVLTDAGSLVNATLRADVAIYDKDGLLAELRGLVLRPIAQGSRSESPFYELQWQRADRESGNRAAWMPSPQSLEAELAPKLEPLARQHGLDAYCDGTRALDAYCSIQIARALGELGWSPKIGDRVDADGLAKQLSISPRHYRLVGRLLDILAEDGLLKRDKHPDNMWTVLRGLPTMFEGTTLADLELDYPASTARIKLLERCADSFPSLLRGEADPLQFLFPDGSTADLEALYRDTPEAKVYNQLARDAVLAMLRSLPKDRRLNVLEIGGGTGGTTSWLVPALPECTEYLFTDLGPMLVAKASERFSAFPFMKFQVFDVEQDAASQGIDPGKFDLIVAANVVHATTDLRATLAQLRALLAPGGMLLLLEIVGRERWVDVTFGLTSGWWRFNDFELRPDFPLLARPAWLDLLEACGFEARAVNPVYPGSSEVVIAARRSVEKSSAMPVVSRLLVLGDAGGIGSEIAQRLRNEGKRVTLIRRCPAPVASVDEPVLQTSNLPELRQAFERLIADVDGIVHLWGLDLPTINDGDPHSLSAGQQIELGSLLCLVQALGVSSFPNGEIPKLWVVTSGAVAATATDRLALAQSPSWGMGRTIALEHPDLRPTWVDLDPDSTPVTQATDLLEAMTAVDDETQIAIRDSVQYVARLAPSKAGGASFPAPAVRLEKSDSGLLEELSFQTAPRRAPGPGEIEILVRATGLNFRDLMNAMAMRDDPEPLGGECAGRVTAVAPDVAGFSVGDDVVALAEGCFATYVLCDARNAVRLPSTMNYATAATIPFAFMTAQHALVDLGKVKARDTVVIHAAAGGVGSAAVQLALRLGAVVIGTAGSETKRAHLLAQGVNYALDSRTTDFVQSVLEITGGRGAEFVLNSLSGEFIDASVNCLAPNGCLLEIGKRDIWTAARFGEVRPNGRYYAIDLAEMRHRDQKAWRALFIAAVEAAERGEIQPLPMAVFPFERAADAYHFMAQAHHIGKIVLTQCDNNLAELDRLPAESTYLITGGLSGVGLATAVHLVEKGARHLALTGRRPASAENAVVIAKLREQGAQVHIIQADVSRSEEVERVFNRIKTECPPLRGIIHSAGVLADASLLQQDWPRFAEVLGPKMDGSWALHVLSRNLCLDFFVMYSSVSSVFGSAGQANHAAANAFMDGLAVYRRAQGLPAVSISWGGWSDIGAAADARLHERLGQKGAASISPEDGLEMLDVIMRASPAHVVACPIDWDRMLEQRGNTTLFKLMRGYRQQPSESTSSIGMLGVRKAARAMIHTAEQAGWLTTLREGTPARRRDMLLSVVGEQVASVVGLPEGLSVDPTQPLNELGLDSLMAVELRNRLGRVLELQRSLPATLVFERPTIKALAEYLGDLLAEATGSKKPQPDSRIDVNSLRGESGGAVEAIDGLSEEQIEEMFARKMRSL